MVDFLHKKKDSSVFYYRRRYPKDVAQALSRLTFMQSLKTTVQRDAARLARQVSVEFDAICQEARMAGQVVQSLEKDSTHESAELLRAKVEKILAGVPSLIRLAAQRVVEEQLANPAGWKDVVGRWQDLHRAMIKGQVVIGAHRPAVEAQAILNGFDLVLQGKPMPAELSPPPTVEAGRETSASGRESWSALCRRALSIYSEKVGPSRYQLAESRLQQIKVQSTAEHHVEAGLLEWAKSRLNEVQPRTVKSQLDCMVSALRGVQPKLKTPYLRELKGVMQPRVGDRQSMPIQEIQKVFGTLRKRPASSKVRIDYGGGASQFDAIAVEVLSGLGMRPRELMQAKTNALCSKTDAFGEEGLFFRVIDGKNKASERDIPLSDGTREVVEVSRLREMLEWQERNPRSPSGAVSSLGTRFKKVTNGYTLYQMRHTWKDIAVRAGVDLELRERIMGHKMPGVVAVYGSGIPLQQGLDALTVVRSAIYGG